MRHSFCYTNKYNTNSDKLIILNFKDLTDVI